MNRMQEQVQAFHEKFGLGVGLYPMMRKAHLRSRLIDEESSEFSRSVEEGDFQNAIKELCDLLYVAFGTAVAWGIDIQMFFDEVHRSNMDKDGGQLREDGKLLKPEGWAPPDMDTILAKEWGRRTK